MKLSFSMRTKSKYEPDVKLKVTIDTKKYSLTRKESRRFKTRLQNRVHQILRDEGYDVNQIRLG